MKKNQDIVEAIEELAALVAQTKHEKRNHTNNVLVNVLQESELTKFRKVYIVQSLNIATDLFRDQIEYTGAELEKRRSFFNKYFLFACLKRICFQFIFTSLSLFIPCFVFLKFLYSYLTQILYLGTSYVFFALVILWIMGVWVYSDFLYDILTKKKLIYRRNSFGKFANIYAFFVVGLFLIFFPSFYESYLKLVLIINEHTKHADLFNFFLSGPGLDVLYLPVLVIGILVAAKIITIRI